MAAAIIAQPIYLAWGNGETIWDTTPPSENVATTALLAEVGRRVVTQAQYVTPDSAGAIQMTSGNYDLSTVPTNYLYFRTLFNAADAAGQTIRELAIFVGTTLDAGVTAPYVTPSQVATPGQMLLLEYITAIALSSSVRQQFEFVLEF
jgi:hypothetical protein